MRKRERFRYLVFADLSVDRQVYTYMTVLFTWRAHDELCSCSNGPSLVRCFTGIVSRVPCLHINYVESAIFLLASSLRQRRHRSCPVDSGPRRTRGAALDSRIFSLNKIDYPWGSRGEGGMGCNVNGGCNLFHWFVGPFGPGMQSSRRNKE